MEWSPEQDRALKAVDQWLKTPPGEREQVFRLFGYAGTGKTTLAKHFAQNIDGTVLFGSYTGKAAHVLRRKGCYNAQTIHKMIYIPSSKSKALALELEAELVRLKSQKPEGWERVVARIERQLKEERENLKRPAFSLNVLNSPMTEASLCVIDECSMVDTSMGEDLLSFGVPVLVLGDPAQLPPVRGAGFFTEQKPDFMLTEIHRQAAENPIIALSKQVWEGRSLKPGNYGTCQVIQKYAGKPVDQAIYPWADQLLVGRNKTREATNKYMRKLLGKVKPMPEQGDKLVCLRNNREAGLLNGQIWTCNLDAADSEESEEYVVLDIHGEDDQDTRCEAWGCLFNGGEPDWHDRREANEFTYGYALTVHKAQGSQWDKVTLFGEGFGSSQHYTRWLYTGITRAAEELKLVLL